MELRLKLLITLFIFTGWAVSVGAQPVGLMPVPTLKDVQVQAGATFDSSASLYTYSYTITNPATNTGEIWTIDIDISQPTPERIFGSQGLTIPFGVSTLTFDEVLAIRRNPPPMVPVGIRAPVGWNGGIGYGFADFTSAGPLTGGPVRILPGETQGGFEIISPGMPTIRQIKLIPDWVLLVDTEEDVTPELERRAREVRESIRFKTKTLGPAGIRPGSYEHWNLLRDDLSQAIGLGWIPDAALASTLVGQLASARQALDANDGTLAKSRLQELLNTLGQSTPAQRRQEAHDLVVLNVQKLIKNPSIPTVSSKPK